ncbi:MAG: leucine-rich repeat domain-containing protein, partial [Bacteroidales bacterium]|nr:leucine-rich repeat domain-containing protein [Bacteroidales bacterium]
DSVQRIPAYLCYGLAITSLTIPNSVTSIGRYAFSGCTSLNHVTFNAQNCEDFGYYSSSDPRLPFTGCTNISTFTLGDSVQRIPAYLCYGLAITSITIPNSVTSIGYEAFYGCSGLTGSLTIPNSVTSIGGSAFEGCSGLTGSLTIPNSVTSIEGYTFYGCSGLTGSLIISDSVASIGERAFYGCGRLKYLSLGRDVYSIGYEAFYGCSSITEITSKATLAPTLGEDAFEGVWSGIPVNIPCGSLAPYQDRWSYFSNFVECGAEEGIDDVEVPAYEVSSEQGGIVVKAAAGERVRVFDIAGRLLYQGRIEEEPWHYRVEKSGVYLVQIADSLAQKVVVIE